MKVADFEIGRDGRGRIELVKTPETARKEYESGERKSRRGCR